MSPTTQLQTTQPLAQQVRQVRNRRQGPQINVGEKERYASLMGGSTLVLLGMLRGGMPGLGVALLGGGLIYRGATGRCGTYQMLGMNTAEKTGQKTRITAQSGIKVEQAITIARDKAEVYRFWRDLGNLPRFMKHIQQIRVLDETKSHWVANAPMGYQVEWEAEIINDRQNELIAWQSLAGSQVSTAGSVHFADAPENRGTEITVLLKFDPPAGKLGAMIARLMGESPEANIKEDLRRLKQLLESGEIATTAGQSRGARKG